MLAMMLMLASKLFSTEPPPTVTLGGWSSSEDFNWVTNTTPPMSFSNSTVHVIPSTVSGLSLICNASYPIQWSFHQEKWGRGHRWIAMLTTNRTADDIYNVTTFQYTAELRFHGDTNTITGNYTCQKVGNEDVSTNAYLFWEGTSPPFLLLAGETRTVLFNKDKSQVFNLPCRVSRPDIQVSLVKEVTQNLTINLPLNKSIQYDPSLGFTMRNLQDPFGHYKCIVSAEQDKDYVDIDVVQGDATLKPEFNNTIIRNATYSYNPEKNQFSCCSSTWRAPKIMHFYCDHPVICKLRMHTLHNIENNSKQQKNGSCSVIKLYFANAGVFRCRGDGIDIVREYFFPLIQSRRAHSKTAMMPFMSWSEADPEKMLNITSRQTDLYVGQTITFDCQVSPYYFSQGLKWGVGWKNNSFVIINGQTLDYGNSVFRLFFRRNHAYIRIVAEINLQSLVCIAPVWNSTEWKNTTITLEVKVPVPPTIEGEEKEEYNWYVNDTNVVLECIFHGDPKPGVTWTKNNRTLRSRGYKTVNGTSRISIPRVSYDSHGEYVCKTTNVGGIAKKIYQVYVNERISKGTIAILVISTLVLIVVLIGVAVLVKRLRSQKQTIQHLARVAFKDVDVPQVHHQIPQPLHANELDEPSVKNDVAILDSSKYQKI